MNTACSLLDCNQMAPPIVLFAGQSANQQFFDCSVLFSSLGL